VELTEALGLLVALADKRLQQLVSLEALEFALTPQQFWVVLLLDQGALGSVQEVGRRIGIDKPAASRLVDTLAGRSWVRFGSGGDSRRRPVELTARGRRQARRFRQVAMKLAEKIEAGITPAQKTAMDAGLRKLIANLDAALDARAAAATKGRRSKSRS
jgi:DNA-binding MarR family transcriptional regulator